MASDTVRAGVNELLTLVLEVMVGMWLLFLFFVALAWDPLDRRLGFHARRHAERYGDSVHSAGTDAAG